MQQTNSTTTSNYSYGSYGSNGSYGYTNNNYQEFGSSRSPNQYLINRSQSSMTMKVRPGPYISSNGCAHFFSGYNGRVFR